MMVPFLSRQRSNQPNLRLNQFCIVVGLWTWCSFIASADAQSVCLPLPRLLTTMPMGGQAGTELEVTVGGEFLEDVGELVFSHPGINASPQTDEAGQIIPMRYRVSIAKDCPPGIYEARVMSRLGISSARAFSVGMLPEAIQKSPNTSLDTAMPLEVNSVCNAVMTEKGVDHYRFSTLKDRRYIIHCSSRGIDSKLDPVVIVADSKGRDLIVDRQGDTIDFVATNSESLIIKVHELTFKGGTPFFYRLILQELPTNEPLPLFASTRNVSAFSWPPAGLAVEANLQESELNEGLAVQPVTLPCDIAGTFYPAADVDVFEFEGKHGEVWWIEVASERLGRPTDPAVLVQQVVRNGSEQTLTDVAEFSDIASPIRPSSNGYAYDGPPYNGGSLDINGQFEIKQDGIYRLSLTDLFGGTRSDNRNRYRLIIRRAAPDFALAAWGLHMELRNGDRNALSKPISLRPGATVALEVVAIRRDGFNGRIDLQMEGLPDGVSAAGLSIPARKSRGILLVTAAENAPRNLANASIVGVSQNADQSIVRHVQLAQMAWPIVDSWGEIPSPRLVDGVPVSVTDSEVAPMSIVADGPEVWEVTSGSTIKIPLRILKRSEFSGTVLQLSTMGDGFEGVPRFDVPLTAETAEAVIDLAALKTPPGDYSIAFYGTAVAKYRYDPNAIFFAESSLNEATTKSMQLASELQRLSDALSQIATADTAAASALKMELAQVTLAKSQADADIELKKQKLKAVSDQAAPRDTVDIVISEPIAIRVK